VTIYVLGAYGHGNLGDDFIGLSVVRHLRSRTNEAVALLAGEYWADAEDVGTQSRANLARLLKRGDTLLVAGGGLFNDRWASDYVKYYSSVILLARALGCRVHISGVGVEKLHTRKMRWLSELAFAVADESTVRDEASARELRLKRPKVSTDLAWLSLETAGLGQSGPAAPDASSLLISIAGETMGGVELRLNLLRDLIPAVQSCWPGLSIGLITMQRSVDSLHDDDSAARLLAEEFKVDVVRPDSAAQASAHLAASRLHLGWRLHAGILTALGGGRNVMISRSRKIQAQLSDVPGSAVIPEGLADVDVVLESLERALTDVKISEGLEGYLRGRRDIAARDLARVVD
jgi:polysaccharide pyruvyl transferase WcaK-like protein